MALTVFYSWQNDTPSSTCRNFIERALKRAVRDVNRDMEVEEAIRTEGIEVDRDTQGVVGQVPIVDTIFAKIDEAIAFVPDLTFVGSRTDGRPSFRESSCHHFHLP